MSNWKKVIAVVLISSCITGGYAFACNKHGSSGKQHHKHHQCGCKKGKFKQKKLDRLSHKLDLTSEQESKIDSILDSSHKKTKAIFDQTRPKMEAIRKSTDQEIKAILDSDQKIQFDKLVEKRNERHKKWHSKFE